jgi:hypothetical protein
MSCRLAKLDPLQRSNAAWTPNHHLHTQLHELVYLTDPFSHPLMVSWNLYGNRLACFDSIVAQLRDIPNAAHRYKTMPALHLETLLGQSMIYQVLRYICCCESGEFPMHMLNLHISGIALISEAINRIYFSMRFHLPFI